MRNTITYLAITLSFCMMLTGCYNEKIAVKQLNRVQSHYPEKVAGACAVWYPVLEFTKDSFIYLPGKPIPQTEIKYVTVDCDSAVEAAKKTGSKASSTKAPCPPCDSLRVDTVQMIRRIQAESTAKLQEQKLHYEDLTDNLRNQVSLWQNAATETHTQLKIAVIAGAVGWFIVIIGILWKIFKPKIF